MVRSRAAERSRRNDRSKTWRMVTNTRRVRRSGTPRGTTKVPRAEKGALTTSAPPRTKTTAWTTTTGTYLPFWRWQHAHRVPASVSHLHEGRRVRLTLGDIVRGSQGACRTTPQVGSGSRLSTRHP